MYAYIRGVLMHSSPQFAVIEAHGVGYQIMIPASLIGKLPAINSECMLYVSFVVRELAHTLYGFLSANERDLFEALMGVTGIGPKSALSLIGHMDLDDLHAALSQNNISAICKVPGIGKKTAERLILELRDKLPSMFIHNPSEFTVKFSEGIKSQQINDAMSALINLGYHQHIAQKAIKKTLEATSQDIELGALITAALKHI